MNTQKETGGHPMTERQKQEKSAFANCANVYRWHFLCDDNTTFSAISPSQSGALRVLNAERPGILFTLDGATSVPVNPGKRFWGSELIWDGGSVVQRRAS